jgi:hypothetical protein
MLNKVILLYISLLSLYSYSNTYNENISVILSNPENYDTKIISSIIDTLIKYKITDYNPQIIDLYYKPLPSYYQDIIKNKILRLLIITNDKRGEKLFISILSNNTIKPEIKILIDYLQFYNNPSDNLILTLKNLKNEINKLINTNTNKTEVYKNILLSIENCLIKYNNP